MVNNSITVRLAPNDLDAIDKMVVDGYFTSRSDLIRASIRRYVDELRKTAPIISKLSREANRKSISREDVLKASRKARRDIYREVYGND